VADTGNHRLLIWSEPLPGGDHQDADILVGQTDMTTDGPGLLFLPTGVLVDQGRLVVADAWHHRILVWDQVPTSSGTQPSMVLGQDDLSGVDEGCGPQRFYWPFGVAMIDGAFWVADTGNRRVLGWCDGLPTPGQPADVVLGQPDLVSRGENRDGPVAANSLRWPHSITTAGGYLCVADAGNHRILGWRGHPTEERPADVVFGQSAFDTCIEFPYRPQGPAALRFPYGLAASPDGSLYVADTSNNRVLVIDDAAATFGRNPGEVAADRALGQIDLDANGENRWESVRHDTLCWPYGLAFHDGRLAVADSGNNRVVLWSVSR
jgi:DNA-binding beta-propeller fold protein YncE